MPDRVQELIETLRLAPHPERGFYVETYRARLAVDAAPHGARAPRARRSTSW